MQVLIIEDELPAAKLLAKMLKEIDSYIVILDTIDSIDMAVKWLLNFPTPHAIFMDIQIADGLSFDIFEHTNIQCPVVFTTAFDHYAIKAFKVNAIDYLLKPIDTEELRTVVQKIKANLEDKSNTIYTKEIIEKLLHQIKQQVYKDRFLVKSGSHLLKVDADDIAYFYSEDGITQLKQKNSKKYIVEHTIEEIENLVDPSQFFRINRKMIIHSEAIQKIHTNFNNRLKLELLPLFQEETFVSRERVSDFKKWLGGG
jgi:two-component system, LytTR family, response regulator LytT